MASNEDIKWNESGGRLFEFISIEMLTSIFPEDIIEWQPKGLETMIIQPDIGVYDKNHNLRAVGLSGHATTKNSAGMKVDRSIEELFEAKESLPKNVKIFSIIWHSPNGWSAGQLKRMDEAFDYNFVVYRECNNIWKTIVPEINTLAISIKGTDEATSTALVKSSTIPARLAAYMVGIRNIIESQSEKNGELWEEVRKSYNRITPYEHKMESHIKEALTPLMWLPISSVEQILEGKSIDKNEISDTFIRLGGATPSVHGVKANSLITDLTRYFSKEIILNTVMGLQTAEGVNTLLDSLKSSERIQSRINRTVEAVKSRKLYSLCLDSQDSTDPDYTGRCWPFEVLTTWIKLKIDNKFGLVEAQRETIGDTKTDFGWDPIIYYTEGHWDYLSSDAVKSICQYLELKVGNSKNPTVRELSSNVLVEARKDKINNPLQWILRKTLEFYHLEYEQKISFQCVFASKAGLAASSGRTTFQLKVDSKDKKYIIHTFSAYSSTHKDVEFSGKTRLYYLTKPGNIEIIYVLDGDKWPERSKYMFERAGATVILASQFENWVKDTLL